MKKKFSALMIFLTIAFMALLSACEQEGPAEEAGENIDQAIEETGDAIEEAGDDITN